MPDFEDRAPDWLSYEEALARILSAVRPLPPRGEGLLAAAGLALAEEILSPLTLPPGPTSHMDGYALRADGVHRGETDGGSAPLPVLGTSRPGSPWGGVLPTGSAIRIMTGALLPEGADSVVPVERTDRESATPGEVRLQSSDLGEGPGPVPGQHVRARGEEVEEGECLAVPGDTLGLGRLALLAATGLARVRVHPPPRVALLVTGDELVEAEDAEALAGGVRRADLLSPTLPLLLRSAGAVPLPPRRVPDDRDRLREALLEAAEEADLVLTTGGASMGEADLVKGVLESLGARIDFWRVRIRPGSPVSLARLPRSRGSGEVPILSLPGNPISSIVTCTLFALPAVRALGGHRNRHLRRIRATAREPFPGPATLTRFFRVRLESEGEGGWGARTSGAQGSGGIRSAAAADGLALLPEGVKGAEPGDPIEVLLLPGSEWVADG